MMKVAGIIIASVSLKAKSACQRVVPVIICMMIEDCERCFADAFQILLPYSVALVDIGD